MAKPAQAPRAWQRMLSGRRLDLLDPSPVDVEISDIAHGLARVARWNGQTRGDHAYSVAQHSLLVDHIYALSYPSAPAAERLAVLLHDAPEYVIGDMISPFKAIVGGDYKAVEARLQGAIHLRFGLAPQTAQALHEGAAHLPAHEVAHLVQRFEQLVARHFERGWIVAGGDQFAEARRARDVGALADVHERNLVGKRERL